MKNRKILTTTLAVVMALSMIIPTQANAEELQQTSLSKDRSNIAVTMSLDNGLDTSLLKDVYSVPQSSIVDPEEEINVSEGSDAVQARVGTSLKYDWSCNTAPYTFTQTWSTDQEVYSTYPFYDDGFLYPAATELLTAPSNLQYSTAVREGYVNDSWATEYSILGAHVYYHTVTSDERLNSVTVLLDKNVAFQVYDMDLNPVLDTESSAYSNLLLYYNLAVTHNGSYKEVHTFKLAAGEYFIMFWDNGSGTGNFHYAMFTGNPLPIKQTYSAGGAFQGSIKWDGVSTSQTYQGSGVTISLNGGSADLFALYRVTFTDMGSAYYNAYVDSAAMMYQSPNSYSYKTIANIANLRQDMIDYYPDKGSIVGTYNTKVTVNWRKNLSYINASYFTNAILYIDYLAPLGEVKVSF